MSMISILKIFQDGGCQLVEDEEGARRPPRLLRAHHQLHAQVHTQLVKSLLLDHLLFVSGSTSPMLLSI